MNELQAVDLVERLRAWILQRRPATEAELRAVPPGPETFSPTERRLRALAGFLKVDCHTAAGRRELRRIMREVEDGNPSPTQDANLSPGTNIECDTDPDSEADWNASKETDMTSAGQIIKVREAGLPRQHASLTPARRKQICRLWAWVESECKSRGRRDHPSGKPQPSRTNRRTDERLEDEPTEKNSESEEVGRPDPPTVGEESAVTQGTSSPESLVRSLRETLPFLKGSAPCRVLEELGYDVAQPDLARQRVLFRLGLMTSPPAAQEARRMEAFEAMARLARLAGESVRGIALLLGLFSGTGSTGGVAAMPSNVDDRSSPRKDGVGLCRVRPLCLPCPLGDSCLYRRFDGGRRPTGRTAGRIKEWAEEDRPRERLARHGAAGLGDADLLALVLRTGTGNMSAVDLARETLARFESLERLDQASFAELETVPGIGPAKAAEVKAAFELGKRVFRSPLATGRRLTSSRDVFQAMRSTLAGQMREQFLLLALNTKNEILRVLTVSIGSLTQSLVHPREVFREAIREAAASVMLIHNHPSGDPAPSRDDEVITQRLCRAGDLLGIRVLDHIIIGRDRYFSFADEGRLRSG